MKTVVLYHENCPDGFGAAFAAWKKFGNDATYHALGRGETPPLELCEGADVYMLDFTYNEKSDMDALEAVASKLTVLDHHEGVKDVTRSMANHVYDSDRSGAGISWDFFHPDLPRPRLIDHVEDDDLFRFKLSDTRSVLAYLGLHPFEFAFWDETMQALDDPARAESVLSKARIFGECFEKLAELSVNKAKMVEFEGHTIAFATAHPYKPIKSLVGNLLAKKHPPFAIVVDAHPLGFGVSMRGDGSMNLTKIAQKYGGNGHFSSVGFLIPLDRPVPWKFIEPND